MRARIACALRNERSVKTLVPVRNCKLVRATVGLATMTLLTICVEREPSLTAGAASLPVLADADAMLCQV